VQLDLCNYSSLQQHFSYSNGFKGFKGVFNTPIEFKGIFNMPTMLFIVMEDIHKLIQISSQRIFSS
jgi:hypothetical protein